MTTVALHSASDGTTRFIEVQEFLGLSLNLRPSVWLCVCLSVEGLSRFCFVPFLVTIANINLRCLGEIPASAWHFQIRGCSVDPLRGEHVNHQWNPGLQTNPPDLKGLSGCEKGSSPRPAGPISGPKGSLAYV